MLQGACREQPANFYPPMHTERKHERLHRERQAKALCAICVVRDKCLDYAITNEENYGIWGGMNEEERRVMPSRPKRRAG